jgi:hypothetical protein
MSRDLWRVGWWSGVFQVKGQVRGRKGGRKRKEARPTMQVIHAPLVAPTAITHATWIPGFLDGEGGLVVAGGTRVRVYERGMRRVYDQCWGGEVEGLEGVALVGGRAGVVVGLGGKVSARSKS